MKLRYAALGLLCAMLPWFAAAQMVNKEDVAKGRELANSKGCTACHGADGNSTMEANPKLAGQHHEYLQKQLHNFKVGKGETVASRAVANSPMGGMAAALTDEEIRQLAAWFSNQKFTPAKATNEKLAEAGRKIYRAGIASKSVAACAGCHGPNGAGLPPLYPAVSGQFAAYTEGQLKAFRSGERNNSKEMKAIAANLSDAEIKALSEYIAGIR